MSLIDKYIDDKDSICREERQYAVFLYNYLNSMKNKEWSDNEEDSIKSKLFGEGNIKITHVFYEATFMRDFFYWDRKNYKETKSFENENLSKERFNKYLLDYVRDIVNDENGLRNKIELGKKVNCDKKNWCCTKQEKDNLNQFMEDVPEYYYEYHLGMAIGRGLGKGKKQKIDLGETINQLLKALMNSKPDIAVLFEKDNKSTLAFFECKFESPEGSSGKEETKISQTEAQNAIAYFLTKYFAANTDEEKCNENEKSNNYENLYQVAEDWEKTKIVNFYRDKSKNNKCEVDIRITDLIEFNK